MNPRAPQPSGTPPQLQPDRPNPWGGAVAAAPTQPVPQPAPPSPASAVHQLQCPHCRAGLTLKHEHIGINGSCIHCNTPIRAIAYQDGQVAIELIENQAAAPVAEPTPTPQETPAKAVDVAVELHPSVPASPVHQEAANHATETSSFWQSPPEQQAPVPEQQPAAPTLETPEHQQTHAAPPAVENAASTWGQQAAASPLPTEPPPASSFQTEPASASPFQNEPAPASSFQSESASASPFQNEPAPATSFQTEPASASPFQNEPAPATSFQTEPASASPFQNQPAPAPQSPQNPASPQHPAGIPQQVQPAAQAFPSPNGSMPWTNAPAQPPVVEQENFDSFQAASPFASPPHLQEEAQAPTPVQAEPVTHPNVSNSGSRLGKTKRKPRLGLLKFVATVIILGGLGYAAFLFAPQEKVNQIKHLVGEFVHPALEVFKGKNGMDSAPAPPAVPENPVSPSAPATTTPTAPASAITPDQTTAPEDPKETTPTAQTEADSAAAAVQTALKAPVDPVSEQLRVNVAGTIAISQFYRAKTIEERLPFFVDTEKSRLPYEAYVGRFQNLPTLKSVALQTASLDVATGRWYGIFEIAEKENEKLHRWIVIEDENGEFKLDWQLYEQLIDDALPRYLDDPTAPPREFRLAIRKGATPVIDDNNPWNSEAVELLIQTPFDSQSARTIILKKSDYEALGLAEVISTTTAKTARVEMVWVSSEYDPNGRVPIITKLIGWGAWEEN